MAAEDLLSGTLGGLLDMPEMTYSGLQSKYLDFSHPKARVLLGGEEFESKGGDVIVGNIYVENTSGYEASVATFRLYDVFDQDTGRFKYDKVKKQVVMGNCVEIQLGYISIVETVFVGFVSGVSFGYEGGDLPYVEVTAMDVKGVMMGGAYAYQLTATTYSGAVKEILERTGEGALKQLGGITELVIHNTPDAMPAGLGGAAGALGDAAAAASALAGGGDPPPAPPPPPVPATRSSPITVEMVGESDYEFVVRAAKRYNFEFFVDRGRVLFRPAKSKTNLLLKMGVGRGLQTFHIEYSITGVVGEIEARAMDPGKGEAITAKSKFSNTISTGAKAKGLVGVGAKVYVDPSISSKEEAEARVSSLMDKMSYRLGSLEAECVGIPDLVPGRFIEVEGMGKPVDNRFYITSVTHEYSDDGGYRTQLKGCTDQVAK